MGPRKSGFWCHHLLSIIVWFPDNGIYSLPPSIPHVLSKRGSHQAMGSCLGARVRTLLAHCSGKMAVIMYLYPSFGILAITWINTLNFILLFSILQRSWWSSFTIRNAYSWANCGARETSLPPWNDTIAHDQDQQPKRDPSFRFSLSLETPFSWYI